MRRDGRAVRRDRRPLQQRRHLTRRRCIRARHLGRGVGPRAGGQHAGCLPLLQARDPVSAGAGWWVGDQRRELRRHPRRSYLPDLLQRLEGRGAVDEPRARRPVRAPGRTGERVVSRAGRDAAAPEHLRRQPGGARTPTDPLADGPAGEAARDRECGPLPRQRRVVVRERVDVPRRRRPDAAYVTPEALEQ